MKQYDYLVVGAGLFGAVFARQAADAGKKVLVIDKRDHIAGNVYTEQVRESMYIVMEPIFFTRIIKQCGIILHGLQSLTVLRTALSQIIRGNYIACLLICTRSIRSGVL